MIQTRFFFCFPYWSWASAWSWHWCSRPQWLLGSGRLLPEQRCLKNNNTLLGLPIDLEENALFGWTLKERDSVSDTIIVVVGEDLRCITLRNNILVTVSAPIIHKYPADIKREENILFRKANSSSDCFLSGLRLGRSFLTLFGLLLRSCTQMEDNHYWLNRRNRQ